MVIFLILCDIDIDIEVQGQCTMGCAADESGMEGGFSAS
jgi:hypothetical protein